MYCITFALQHTQYKLRARFYFYHRLFKSRGIYSFAGRSFLRLLIIAAIITVLLVIAQSTINDFHGIIDTFLLKWDAPFVLSLFFVSESILGMIPPDFFIVWSNTTSHPMVMLTLLAFISYSGGLIAYFIGKRIASFPKFHTWLMRKFSSHLATLHKYGGFLIIFSALFPLPFSTITLITGMINYPFKRLAILGLTRLFRFYLYATVLFQIF